MELRNQDQEVLLASLSIKDVINSITLDDVKNFLESLGVDQIEVNNEKQYLVCPTICHNPLEEATSMKLYWYQNNKIFRCYTECNEAMSIFELYRRYMSINHYPISLEEAEDYVKQFLHHITVNTYTPSNSIDLDIEKYKYNTNIPLLDEYPMCALDCFTKYYHPLWLKDGIKRETMDKFLIRFSPNQNKIIIPHFDIKGRLIGIRGRALEEEEIEASGKYKPVKIGNTLYTHLLQFNLYGINFHKEGIMRRRCAIIAEAEKSVMLDDGYYGKLSNTVACCGSTFNKYHISLLTNILGANEIVIAFDKEYEDWRTEKAKKYREKLEYLCRRFSNQATFSYIWDYDNLLEEKDSPFDKGKEVFEKLFKNRIRVK